EGFYRHGLRGGAAGADLSTAAQRGDAEERHRLPLLVPSPARLSAARERLTCVGRPRSAAMLKLLLSRLATAIPSIVGVVIVTFMLTRLLPGDPAAYFAGLAASPQAIAEIRT